MKCVVLFVFLHAAGVIDCAKKTVQWEGLPGLYKVRLTCAHSMAVMHSSVQHMTAQQSMAQCRQCYLYDDSQ